MRKLVRNDVADARAQRLGVVARVGKRPAQHAGEDVRAAEGGRNVRIRSERVEERGKVARVGRRAAGARPQAVAVEEGGARLLDRHPHDAVRRRERAVGERTRVARPGASRRPRQPQPKGAHVGGRRRPRARLEQVGDADDPFEGAGHRFPDVGHHGLERR